MRMRVYMCMRAYIYACMRMWKYLQYTTKQPNKKRVDPLAGPQSKSLFDPLAGPQSKSLFDPSKKIKYSYKRLHF